MHFQRSWMILFQTTFKVLGLVHNLKTESDVVVLMDSERSGQCSDHGDGSTENEASDWGQQKGI